MPVYTKEGKNILFVHIPKTAGASINDAFLKSGFSSSWINIPAVSKIPNQKPCNPQHFHAELVKKYILGSIDLSFSFTVIREPLRRLISEYTWHNMDARKYILDFGYDSKFFDDFQIWAINQFNLYKKNNYHEDNHLRPQSEFIIEDLDLFQITNMHILSKRLFDLGVKKIEKVNVSNSVEPPKTFEANKNFKEIFFDMYDVDYNVFGFKRPFIN